MQAELSPVIAATTQWLTRSYPAYGGAFSAALCEAQARQAVTVAARLRHPTPMDAALVAVAGPGGSARLDRISGADDAVAAAPDEHAWRSWVDEAVASWAACLLGDAELADRAVAALADDGVVGAGRSVAALAEDGAVRAEPSVARRADHGAVPAEPSGAAPVEYRRLLAPDAADRRAAALLRHPDLLAPVADLHRAQLLARLDTGSARAA